MTKDRMGELLVKFLDDRNQLKSMLEDRTRYSSYSDKQVENILMFLYLRDLYRED